MIAYEANYDLLGSENDLSRLRKENSSTSWTWLISNRGRARVRHFRVH